MASGEGAVSARQRRPNIMRGSAAAVPPLGMRRVTVNTVGDGYTSIDAWVFGEWAAHIRIGGGRAWDVTYLPAGMNITSNNTDTGGKRRIDPKLSEERAKRLADWLDCHTSRDELYDWSRPSAELVDRIHQGLEMVTTDVAAFAGGMAQ